MALLYAKGLVHLVLAEPALREKQACVQKLAGVTAQYSVYGLMAAVYAKGLLNLAYGWPGLGR